MKPTSILAFPTSSAATMTVTGRFSARSRSAWLANSRDSSSAMRRDMAGGKSGQDRSAQCSTKETSSARSSGRSFEKPVCAVMVMALLPPDTTLSATLDSRSLIGVVRAATRASRSLCTDTAKGGARG